MTSFKKTLQSEHCTVNKELDWAVRSPKSRPDFVLHSSRVYTNQRLVWTLLPNDKYWNRSMLFRLHISAKISLVSCKQTLEKKYILKIIGEIQDDGLDKHCA